MPTKPDLLTIKRYNGLESFVIGKARFRVWRDDDEGLTRAVFEISTRKAVATLDGTRDHRARPTWAIEWSGKKKLDQVLCAGARLRVPSGYDDDTDEYLTAFCYFDQETSEKNAVEILSVGDKTVRATLTGRATDVNFYDGSKPAMRIEATTTFTWGRSLANGQLG